MRPRIGTWVGLLASAMVLVACAGSPAPSASSPTPSAASSAPAASGYRLRATTTQATPPLTRFDWLPLVAITSDLQLVVPGPMIEIHPGPLLPNLQAKSVSAEGFQRIVDHARTLGLLSGDGDLTPDTVAPGSTLGRVEIVVDGVRYDLTGDPSRIVRCGDMSCLPAPGTPEAFGSFWGVLSDMAWLNAELGEQAPYVADAYAILVGVEPAADPTIQPGFATWPLETPVEAFGKPVGSTPTPRCGTARGADAATLRPAFAAANQLTRWGNDGVAPGTGLFIEVRPMVPGEDICQELFGLSD